MTEMTLITADHRTISFEGELITRQSSRVQLGDGSEAVLELSLYAALGGGFVPIVEFKSSASCVEDVVDAERVDLVKDVECFFLLFEPVEHIDFRAGIGLSSATAKQQLRRMMTQTYFGMMDDILNALADYHTSYPSCETVAKSRCSDVSRIWNFFGLGRD